MTLYFQLKDEAQLALKRMPAAKQEALFMGEYQQGLVHGTSILRI